MPSDESMINSHRPEPKPSTPGKSALKTAFRSPVCDHDEPPPIIEIKSNLSQNTQAMIAEADYQAAMSALNESFLKRPPPKILSRAAMHHKITWDSKEGTFLLFKNQYEAHLMSSQQDYATDPAF
jgi:hypothetical protein